MSAPEQAQVAFDPVDFVADLRAVGCAVVLSLPGTVFRAGDQAVTWFVRPAPGYTAVMARWADAMDADPDHVELVAEHLLGTAGNAA